MDEEYIIKPQKLKANDWSNDFTLELYKNIAKNKIYITNLGNCTQEDARPLSNKFFL
jgi:hypothetical protein